MPPDNLGTFCHLPGMAKPPSEALFKANFLQRVRDLRDAKGWTQTYMAEMLGVPYENYKKWEKRDYMPHYVIPRFVGMMGVSIEFLYTGRGHSVDNSKGSQPGRAVKRRATRFSVVPQR